MHSRESILDYRRALQDMRDNVDHHAMQCELTGRIKALEWVLNERAPCPECEHGILSPLYGAGDVEPAAFVCDECGRKVDNT